MAAEWIAGEKCVTAKKKELSDIEKIYDEKRTLKPGDSFGGIELVADASGKAVTPVMNAPADVSVPGYYLAAAIEAMGNTNFLDDIREHKTEYLFSGSVGQVFGEQSALLAEGKVSVKDAAITVLNAYYKERKLKHSYASVKAETANYGTLAEEKELYEEGGIKLMDRITPDMPEDQRAEILKKASVYSIVDKKSQLFGKARSLQDVRQNAKKEAEKYIYPLAEELEILNYPLRNKTLEFEVTLSKNNGLKESLSKQLLYGGGYQNFGKALVNLKEIFENSTLIYRSNKDRYKGTVRESRTFETKAVLLECFETNEYIIPVKFEIKKQANISNGNLYLVVSLTEIKRTSVLGRGGTTNKLNDTLPDTGYKYNLPQLVSNVNTKDADFLKYIPNELLSVNQIDAKHRAITENAKKEEISKFLADLRKIHEEYAQGVIEYSSNGIIYTSTQKNQDVFSKEDLEDVLFDDEFYKQFEYEDTKKYYLTKIESEYLDSKGRKPSLTSSKYSDIHNVADLYSLVKQYDKDFTAGKIKISQPTKNSKNSNETGKDINIIFIYLTIDYMYSAKMPQEA